MSYIQDLLTDEDVFPTKAGRVHLHRVLPNCTARFSFSFSFKLSSLPCFSRCKISDRLRVYGPEGVSVVVQDNGSHLLVSLHTGPAGGSAPAPQHAFHAPDALLPAPWAAGSRRHWATAGPHHSFGTTRVNLKGSRRYCTITSLHAYLFLKSDCLSPLWAKFKRIPQYRFLKKAL